MGWLWASSKPPTTTTSTPSPEPIPHPPTPETSPPSPPSPVSDPNPDLTAFLTALRPPPNSAPPTPTSPHTTTTPLTPLHTQPTTLSCRAAFDTAFYCASLGGQFTSLYRHGSLRSCSQQWADFWFCVRTNRGMYGDEEREKRVLRRSVSRERERYGEGLSSEDVWEQRVGLVRGAFGGDYWGAVRAERGEGGMDKG